MTAWDGGEIPGASLEGHGPESYTVPLESGETVSAIFVTVEQI